MSLLIQGVGRIRFFVVVGQKSPFPSCLSTKGPSPPLEASAFLPHGRFIFKAYNSRLSSLLMFIPLFTSAPCLLAGQTTQVLEIRAWPSLEGQYSTYHSWRTRADC